MGSLKKRYNDNVYGIMFTLAVHVVLFFCLYIGELGRTGVVKEEVILVDFVEPEIPKPPKEKVQEKKREIKDEKFPARNEDQGTNAASNSTAKKASSKAVIKDQLTRDLEEAQRLADQVNKNLSKRIPDQKEFKMPEETTAGQHPDSISNVIYKGKSNISYALENRYHLSIPIPVYLAQSGGEVIVDIEVSRKGKVVSAIPRSGTYADEMLPEYARQAAIKTRFNSDSSAPSRQQGTITFNFVSQ